MGRWWERISGPHLSPQPQVQQEAVRVLLSGGGFWWEDQDQWVSCVSPRHECGGSCFWAVGMDCTSRLANSNGFLVFQNISSSPCREINFTPGHFLVLLVMFTFRPGLFWRLMNQHQTTMEGSFYLETMGTCTFSQETVEWQEIPLGNMEMLRTSKMSTEFFHN